MPSEARETIENVFEPTYRNYDDTQGTQTVCQILKRLAGKTDIASIDEQPTVWQLIWTEVAWPQGEPEELCTRDGERLFPQTVLMDATGPGPRVRMTEASVLKLAQVKSKEEFLDNHAKGKHTFPAMACLKIVREVQMKPSSGAHPTESQTEGSDDQYGYVNFTVVQADDQPLVAMPTKSMLELIPLLPQLHNDTACILPAPLRLVKACTHYAFQVCMPNGVDMPCQKILSLVKSTQASQMHDMGAGWKLVTEGVEDALANDIAHLVPDAPATYVLSSTCHKDNISAYKLDPSRGSDTGQHALVTITAKAGDAYVVDQVQQLSPDQAALAKVSLLKLLRLAMDMNSTTLKRGEPWSETESPAKAKKCKTLGRCPTAEPLEEPFP